MATDTRTEALSFLKDQKTGVLATLSPEGGPHARTLYYASDDEFNVFFLTLTGTRKVADINHDRRAAFVVSADDVPQSLQMEGVVYEITDTALIDPVVVKLMDTLMAKGPHFAPLTHFDAGRVLYYRFAPTHIRWGHFKDGEGTDQVVTEIPVS